MDRKKVIHLGNVLGDVKSLGDLASVLSKVVSELASAVAEGEEVTAFGEAGGNKFTLKVRVKTDSRR